jgi:arsenate reductase-like glutaredoxin family protein
MNIQIFGTKKSSDTRKAERFFKERGIKFQSIDLKEKGLSKGEFNSVMQAVGGVDAMIDPDCKDKDLLALVTYISADERAEKVMENQSVIRQPIVRNGRQATVGYVPEVWKTCRRDCNRQSAVLRMACRYRERDPDQLAGGCEGGI